MKTTTSYQFMHNGSVTKFVIRFGKLTDVREPNLVTEYKLYQNYPNPFNPTTKISYSIKEKSFVSIKLYNLLGKDIAEIVNEEKEPGLYEIELNANELKLTSGIYFYKMVAGNYSSIKKLVYLK
jgi:hypothetical protein